MSDDIKIRDLIDSGSCEGQAVYILSRDEFEQLKRDYRAQRNLRVTNPKRLYFQTRHTTKYPDNEVCTISRPSVQDPRSIEQIMTIVIADDDESERKNVLVQRRAVVDEIESDMNTKLSTEFRDFEEDEIRTPELMAKAIGRRREPRPRKTDVIS